MISIQDLIKGEEDAISMYEEFLRQEPHSKKIIHEIRGIINDEKDHKRILGKL